MEISMEKYEGIVPVVDLKSVGLGSDSLNEKDATEVGQHIYDAFANIGFVYLINHGIPLETIEQSFKASLDFFHLPTDKKKIFPHDFEKIHGYIGLSEEKHGSLNESQYSTEIKECYHIRLHDGAFPDESCPQFRQANCKMLPRCRELSERVMRTIALAMGEKDTFFDGFHKEVASMGNMTLMRVLHYPPITSEFAADVTRSAAHTDYGTMSLFFQDDVGGLEVQDRDGNWVPVPPMPGAILCYIGDMMEIWTDGVCKATLHRVMAPKDEALRGRLYQSIVYFYVPDNDVQVKPLNGSSRYSPTTPHRHIQDMFQKTFD